MVGVRYTKDGEEREFKVATKDDTNLMLGNRKSILTVFRTHRTIDDDRTLYEYWIKSSSFVKINGSIRTRISGVTFLFDNYERFGYYPDFKYYPQQGRKLVFDSHRTALCRYAGTIDGFIGKLYLLGMYSPEYEKDDEKIEAIGLKDFDVYGYIFDTSNSGIALSTTTSVRIADKQVQTSDLYGGRTITMLWSGKCASIKDGEIVSNDTPEQNTYYVVVENKKGEVLDVKTTTEFGVTVGSLIGSYSDKFSESVLNQRVVDDLVIKMK